MFYRQGDGANRDISAVITNDEGISGSERNLGSDNGAAEFLRIGTCGGDERVGESGGGLKQVRVSLWAIGRISLRVEARSFDQPIEDECQVAAETAFVSSWATRMQVFMGTLRCENFLCARDETAGST